MLSSLFIFVFLSSYSPKLLQVFIVFWLNFTFNIFLQLSVIARQDRGNIKLPALKQKIFQCEIFILSPSCE